MLCTNISIKEWQVVTRKKGTLVGGISLWKSNHDFAVLYLRQWFMIKSIMNEPCIKLKITRFTQTVCFVQLAASLQVVYCRISFSQFYFSLKFSLIWVAMVFYKDQVCCRRIIIIKKKRKISLVCDNIQLLRVW